MDKINIALYGGKSIFGGREAPLQADIVYCDKYNKCSFYKDGKCFSAGRWKQNCKFGRKQTETGYTSKAKKYYDFRKKYDDDKYKNKLEEPNCTIGKIEDVFVLNIGYLYQDKDTGEYRIETSWGRAELVYIEEKEFTNSLIKMICDGKPKTIFDDKEIKKYQEKIVPTFLYELKNKFNNIYERFVEEYPECLKIEMNFKGKEAYIYSLREGIELKDYKNRIWIKEQDTLLCKNDNSAFLPFQCKVTETRIKITEDMIYEIKDNSEVDEYTKFKD